MSCALDLARKAFALGEVPVGCVIVFDGKVVAGCHNLTQKSSCSILHAEVLAIRRACGVVKSSFLTECDLYVTMEPCPMCAYAIRLARVRRVYFGCFDYKNGAFGGNEDVSSGGSFAKMDVYGGIMEGACGDLLKDFFADKR